MIKAVLVCVQLVSPSTLKHGSGTTEWLGMDAALWWTPGGKQVTECNKMKVVRPAGD